MTDLKVFSECPLNTDSNAFANQLRMLLDRRNARLGKERWTAAALAEALGVDSSLIRHWLRGSRVPSREGHYIERIGVVLELTGVESQVLNAAWSTSVNRPRMASGPSRTLQGALVAAFSADEDLTTTWSGVAEAELFAPTVEGAAACRARARDLLHYAATKRTPPAGDQQKIVYTVRGADDPWSGGGEDAAWRMAVAEVLRNNWRVEPIWNLTKDMQRSSELVRGLLSLLGVRGWFAPRYFRKQGMPFAPVEYLLIPGFAAMAIHPVLREDGAEDRDAIVTVLHERNRRQATEDVLRVVEGHIRRLRDVTTQMFALFIDRRRDFLESVESAEGHESNRILIKDGLPAVTRPERWYQEPRAGESAPSWPLSAAEPGAVPTTMDAERSRWRGVARLQSFRAQIGTRKWIDICTKRAVLRLLNDGWYHPDDLVLHPNWKPTPEEAIEQVEFILGLLHDYPNYELVLADDSDADKLIRHVWEVREVVLLECYDASEGGALGSHIDLIIQEESLVNAMREYAENIYQQIVTSPTRDREYVQLWLEKQLAKARECLIS